MLNETWVIDFGWCASPAVARVLGDASETLRVVESRRRRSREMFAATRVLLAEARAALATSPFSGTRTDNPGHAPRLAAGHAVAAWHPSLD